jgi:hypothetical protein
MKSNDKGLNFLVKSSIEEPNTFLTTSIKNTFIYLPQYSVL